MSRRHATRKPAAREGRVLSHPWPPCASARRQLQVRHTRDARNHFFDAAETVSQMIEFGLGVKSLCLNCETKTFDF